MKKFHFYLFIVLTISLFAFHPMTAQVTAIGGVSIPFNDFAGADSATGGFASTGFSVGVEIVSKFYFGTEIGISGIMSVYPFNIKEFLKTQPNIPAGIQVESGPWIHLWPTVTLGYTYTASDFISIYGRGHAGLFYGIYPEISAREAEYQMITRSLSIQLAFGSGVGLGVIINKKFDVGVRYLTADPVYNLNTPRDYTTTTSAIDTDILNIIVGYTF